MKAQCLDVMGKDGIEYVKQGEWKSHPEFPNNTRGIVIVIPVGWNVVEISQYAPQPIGEKNILQTTIGIFIRKAR